MKKIGIISELSLNNFNYGNRLQAYALNKYLNQNFKDYKIESIYFKEYDKKKITKFYFIDFTKKVINKVKKILKNKNIIKVDNRIEICNKFTKKYTSLCEHPMTYSELKESNYDIFIVGSDVVWQQEKGKINLTKFLAFKNRNSKLKKISYAASFATDFIPKENMKYIRKYLNDFSSISVRESSSKIMLEEMGITDVFHVCDPTLLLSKNEWKSIEKMVSVPQKYIFVYLLGKDKQIREKIKLLAEYLELKIVTIPDSNGVYDIVDENFGDIKIKDCSIEEWVWLIDNATYVITDSFHGSVFSIIFEKKFIAVSRNSKIDINNRLFDFLNKLCLNDKFIKDLNNNSLDNLVWDYNKANKLKDKFISSSKKFIKYSIGKDGD